nr:MAG TPA: hypothetical protein [Caudoviricetes sp.]
MSSGYNIYYLSNFNLLYASRFAFPDNLIAFLQGFTY